MGMARCLELCQPRFDPHVLTLVAAVTGDSCLEDARATAQLLRYQFGVWPRQLACNSSSCNHSLLPADTMHHRAVVECHSWSMMLNAALFVHVDLTNAVTMVLLCWQEDRAAGGQIAAGGVNSTIATGLVSDSRVL